VRFEAEQYIPFDINEISLAHHVIASDDSADTMDILLIGAQNTLVSQYAQVVSGAGLKLQVLDVSGFALANSFELNYGKLPGQTVALLNMGAGVSNLVVVHNGEVIFSRDVPIGGGTYSSEIHKELGISLEEAESLKLSALGGAAEIPEQVPGIIANTNDMVTDEIRNSFDFFNSSAAGFTISRCYFTGGSSLTPNLTQQLSQATSIEFEQFDPFIKVKKGKTISPAFAQQIAPIVSVSLGLALRKVGD
jgi:type IV pilus assembly protein PilM